MAKLTSEEGEMVPHLRQLLLQTSNLHFLLFRGPLPFTALGSGTSLPGQRGSKPCVNTNSKAAL